MTEKVQRSPDDLKVLRARIESGAKWYFDAVAWTTATAILVQLAWTTHHWLALAMATISAIVLFVWVIGTVYPRIAEAWRLTTLTSRAHRFRHALVGVIQAIVLTLLGWGMMQLAPQALLLFAKISSTGYVATKH